MNRLIRTSLFVFLVVSHVTPSRAQYYGWTKKYDVSGIGNPLAFNHSNHRTIYCGGVVSSDGAVMVSYDRGENWHVLSVIAGGRRLKSIVVSPLDTLTILAGQEGATIDRIMKTTDGGASWKETLTGDFSYFGVPIEFNPAHPDTVFTMTGSKLYKSTDFGSVWSVVNTNTGFDAWCDAALRPDSVDVMYVGDNSGGIWKTNDGGTSFRQVYQTTGEIPMIAIDQQNPAIAFATKYGGGGGLLKTTDYGETWTPVPPFKGIQCWGICIGVDEPGLMLLGTYAPPYSTYISFDSGNNWKEVSCGLTSLLNYGVLALDSSAMFLLQESGMYALQRIDLKTQPISSIGGILRDSASRPAVGAEVKISFTRCDTPYSVTTHTGPGGAFSFDSLYTSAPPVLSAYALDVAPLLPLAHLAIAPIHLDTAAYFGVYLSGTADLFLTGEDSSGYSAYYESALDSLGIKWNFWNTGSKGVPPYDQCSLLRKNIAIYFSGNSISAIDSSTLAGMAAAFAGGTGLYITGQDIVERNASAELFSGLLHTGFAANTATEYVAGAGGDLMDGFAFFTSGGSGAQNQLSRDVLTPLSAGAVPMMSYTGMGDTSVAALRIPGGAGSGKAIVAGFGFEAISSESERREMMRRVIGYLDGSIVLGVRPVRNATRPHEFRLSQNYPNPFNPGTTIGYAIAQAGVVTLTVYDILGREIAALVNERKPAGNYSVTWDAGNLPGGVYYYRLRSGTSGATMKMLLLK